MSDRDKILREIVERRDLGRFAKNKKYIILRDGIPDHSRLFDTRSEAETEVRREVAREAWDAARAAELDESAKALRIYLDDQPGRGPDAEDIIYWLQERAAALRQQQHPKENGGKE